MSDNLPQIRRKGIFKRTLEWFKKLFDKEKKAEKPTQEPIEELTNEVEEKNIKQIEIVKELRNKFSKLKTSLLDEKENNNGKIPFGKQFIASINDFNILDALEELTDEQLLSKYGVDGIEHLISTIESYYEHIDQDDKFEFSLKTSMQINNLLKGNVGTCEELIQTLYMTIFQRYNDDIKKEENYNVSPEFADKVYRFAGEGLHPEVKHVETSEQEMGLVYMTYAEYKDILRIWNQEYETEAERRINTKIEMVKYILPNIRNRMMHGDFNNKLDKEGNKIVKISPYGFKAKFFFDCIVEFYEAVAREIEDRAEQKDILFDFEKVFLNRETANTEIMNDKDKVMTLILPLYMNSFMTYNFKQKNAYDKLRRKFTQEEKAEPKVDFLDEYYKKGKTDSFIYRVVEYNKDKLGKEYTAYEIFEHFRNSVVHNNFRCEGGIIYLQDYDEDGKETARFIISYEMFEELIEKQSKYASRYLKMDFPANPGDNHDEQTNVNIR